MRIPVIKANGNNNSFIIIDKSNLNSDFKITKTNIKKLCLENNNKITDGLVIIENIAKQKYNIDYYNNDGSWETLCVNSLRCIGLLIFNKYNLNKFVVNCGDGEHKIHIKSSKDIQVSMNKPEYRSDEIQIGGYKGYYLFSGAKHFVINYKDNWPSNDTLMEIARKIRFNKYFSKGVNVNFFKINNRDLDVITYEKGIEKIMPSCASGSYACAYHYIFSNKIKKKDIYINNPSGGLFIQIDVENSNYNISGSAEIEYESEILFK